MRSIDHLDARDSMNRSVAEICKEENTSFEQVFYILMLSLPLNQPLASVYFINNKTFDKLLEYIIHSKLTDNFLDFLFALLLLFIILLMYAVMVEKTEKVQNHFKDSYLG